MQPTNILIAGGGPVGLTAALELKRRGFDSTVVDNDSGPTPESRALAINPRTLEILEPSGVTERLLAAGNRIRKVSLRIAGKERLAIDLRQIPHRFNFMLILPQKETETLLIEALQEQGIGIRWNTVLEGFVSAEDHLACTLKKAAGEEIFNADLLIGADGSHSIVRKTLGIDFLGRTVPDEIGLADVLLSDWPHPEDNIVLNIDGKTVVAFFPFGEGRGRFVSNNTDFMNCLPKDAKVQDIGWQANFQISYRQVSTYQRGNVFLAGDAAHIHSPVGGRGMNMGIADSATLAWLIESGKTDNYTTMRHPVGANVLKFTEQQTNNLLYPNTLKSFLISTIAPIALKFPPARNRLFRALAGLETPTPAWL